MKAKKKPIIIDFIYYDGVKQLVRDFVSSFNDEFDNFFINEPMGTLFVKTLEGTSYAVTSNDVIIRGIKGEYYPCKKDIFESTYNIIEEELNLNDINEEELIRFLKKTLSFFFSDCI